jgi:putative nucleotidyltransferase with HDIG domain
MSRPVLIRAALFLATTVAAWGVLSVGTTPTVGPLAPGQLSPQTFEAESAASVVDVEETERLRQEARDAVPPVRQTDSEIESLVLASVNAVFDDIEALVIGDPPDTPTTTLPELPTTTTAAPPEEGSTTTTLEPLPAQLVGIVYIDVDGDREFRPDAEGDRVDRGLERVTVQVQTGDESFTIATGPGGVFSAEVPPGPVLVIVDDGDPEIPEGFFVDTDNLAQIVECVSGEQCFAAPIGFQVNLRAAEEVESAIAAKYPLPGNTISFLVAAGADDVIRAALDEPLHLPTIRQAALQRVLEEFGRRIAPDQLQEARARQRTNPPLVFHRDTGQDEDGGRAAGEVVATFLQANYLINEGDWAEEQDKAAEQVPPVVVEYTAGQVIVREGEVLTQLHIDAINQTVSIATRVQAEGGLLAVAAILVGLLGLYLARFRPEFWARPRMVALLGILIVLAAAAVRGTVALQETASWYLFPAVAFGFMAAVLFDSRIAVLLALAVGVLAAVGAMEPGPVVYATLATLAPVPFASSVSTRGAFRNAVVLSALAAAVIAGATSWFFDVGPNQAVLDVVSTAVMWAFGASVVASMVGLAALQFFEAAFDITTTLGLLDLTDRNHEALQLLQEEAFGTFNHSLMVGTLADAAARAVGANPLLARAMAYYHDLGKTKHPTYFIENQFGIPNPHDDLDPRESARIIRSHVTDGVALARRFKIPSEVTQGIVSHHGDAVMRYFYEKARAMYGDDVDIDDFRHVGHKPRSAETAILMLADSLEAACRAEFQAEEPTPERIEKVVDKVINEKVEDGQLSESPLTLADLTKIRKAFLDSLVGHYHQRIAYPNFPGS